jgi:hypothetical protein
MYKKLIYLVSYVLVVSQACNAVEVARWDFEETSGTTATDQSGLYVATLGGSDTLDVDGRFGSGIDFAGDGGAVVDAASSEAFRFTGDFSIALWVNSDVTWGAHTRFVDISAADGGLTDSYRLFTHSGDDTDNFKFMSRQDGSNTQNIHTRDLAVGTWILLVLRHGLDGNVTMNVLQEGDSVDEAFVAANSESWPTAGPIVYGEAELKLGRMNGTGRKFDGKMDALAFYDEVLTDAQVATMFYTAGSSEYPFARGPSPTNGALVSDTWVNLSWSPGDFAVTHDVYLGDHFSDVKDATRDSDVFRGNQVTTFYVAGFPGFAYPDGLMPGTTYYWKIDEVNEADPNSPWKGPIWSFSIPPKTAYNPDPADGAEFVDPNNVTLTWTPGFGAILHTPYFGDNYDEVNNATGGAPLGGETYKPGPLELEKVYYWRVDEFDAVETHKGDIWSFTTPGAVGNANPANGATDVGMNAILSWTPADSAASHQLYLGTDKEVVRTAGIGSPEDKGSKALGAENYDPGLLDADTTYCWRVDEVDAQGNTAKGPLWIFTTGAFLLIDDFESYTDDDPNNEAIWQTWIDGFGVPDNGSQVGNLLPPYAEQTIVHGGSQSMPLLYVNEAGVTNSEASMTLTAPRDWTQAGVTELSLWFRGSSSNAAEPLYVALSNSAGAPAVVAHDDPSAATVSTWTEWVIPLQAFADQGINLADVERIAIGLGSKGDAAAAGGSGTLYIDDIRLYR